MSASVWKQISVTALNFCFHDSDWHTAARLSAAEVGGRTILWLLALHGGWYLFSFAIAVMYLLHWPSAVFFSLKHSHLILIQPLRTSLYFCFALTMSACQSTLDRFLVTKHCCLSCNLSLSLLVHPLMYLQSLLWLDSSLTGKENAHNGAVVGISPCTVKYLYYLSPCVFCLAVC